MLEIVLAIAGAFFFGFGALFQKKGLTRFPIAKISDKHILLKPFIAFRHLIFNRFWFLGGICSVSGWLVYFYALTLTEYLGIRPLTNLSLVIAVIGGSLWFKEHLCRRELLSISLILLGAIILSSQLSESKSLVTNDEVLVAALLILVLVFCINLGAGILTRRASITEITIPFAAGISYGIAEIFTNL
ncbi:MAG: EamA family transporter, partial [Candidatus Heimdallarchaeota archaeon]|nr:EamA family transporter [Candidatus Heimdallarchaeota archaeon]